jgi:hypothetical protein
VTRRRWPTTSGTACGVGRRGVGSSGIGVKTGEKGVCQRRVGRARTMGFPCYGRTQGAGVVELLWRQLAWHH